MIRSVLLLILLFHFEGTLSQTCNYNLRGKVTSDDGLPLTGATVNLIGNAKFSITDESGSYQIDALCEGKYQIEVRYVGYKTLLGTVKVNSNKVWNAVLQSDSTELNEVVISESHINMTATSTYSSLSGRALEETLGKSLGESLREVPGVNTIQTGPAIFKPVIHGVHSQRVLILNNGIRQEGQNWGVEHAPEVDQFIASNIVVIKDASAIKYGADALGGVVLVNPAKLPTSAGLGGQLHLIGASNNGSAVVSGFLEGGSKKWAGFGWRAQGTLKKAGDSRTADYVLSNTGFEEQNFSIATAYHKEKKGIDFFYSHFNTTIGILRGTTVATAEDLANAMERDIPTYTTSFTYEIKAPRQSVQHDLIKINAHAAEGKNEFRLQYGFQSNRRREFDLRRGSLMEIPALGFLLQTHTLDAEWERSHSDRFQSCWGLNLMYQNNSKMDGTQTIPFIPDFEHISAGVFVVEKVDLKKWTLELGLRYDLRSYQVAGFDFLNRLYRSSLGFGNFSGTFSSKRTLGKFATLTTSLSSAWRPPNMAELYSLGTHQSAASIEYGLLLDELTSEVREYSPANAKTEKALKWVGGYKMEKQKIVLELTAYVNYIFDYIYLRPRGVTEGLRGVFPYFRYTQTDASFIGLDMFATYQLNQNLALTGKASLLSAKDVTKSDYLVFIPSNRADAGLRYESTRVKKFTWNAEAKLRWVGMQNQAPEAVSPREIIESNQLGIDLIAQRTTNFDFAKAPDGYLLLSVGVGASWKLKKSKWDVRLSSENLTNETYREYTNRLRYFANDIGRNMTLGIHFSF
jgi:iron complex outermembrane recepter protein